MLMRMMQAPAMARATARTARRVTMKSAVTRKMKAAKVRTMLVAVLIRMPMTMKMPPALPVPQWTRRLPRHSMAALQLWRTSIEHCIQVQRFRCAPLRPWLLLPRIARALTRVTGHPRASRGRHLHGHTQQLHWMVRCCDWHVWSCFQS